MKQKFLYGVLLFMAVAFAATSAVTYFIQTKSCIETQENIIQAKFDGFIGQIDAARQTVSSLQREFSDTAIEKARMTSYLIAADPSILDDSDELRYLRNLLNIEEIVVTDANGIITYCTEPSYIGFDMASTDQSAAFLPALQYPTFEYVQEPQMNGIGTKVIQYAGVSRRDAAGLVQVGIYPEKLEEAEAAADISKLTTNYTIGNTGELIVIDANSGNIVAAADAERIGQSIYNQKLPQGTFTGSDGGGYYGFTTERQFYRFQKYAGYILLGQTPVEEVFAARKASLTLVVCYNIGLFILILILVNFLLNRYIIRGVKGILSSLQKITAGDLNEVLDVRPCPELAVLSDGINTMVSRLKQTIEHSEELKEEAIHATQAKSTFLANMSHEIRTPMNAIMGMSELLMTTEQTPMQRGYAENIKSASNSLLAIINDVLDFSKIEAGKMEIIPVEYKMASLVNDVVNIIGIKASQKSLNLLADIDPSMPADFVGDEIRIKQILINLMNNAVKFTQKGYVKLSIRYQEGSLHLSVSDTGQGIKEEDIGKLFGSFNQVDTKKNRNIEGTGLGLAISKQLATLMGGKIWVESVYGQGSTFYLEIPQPICEGSQPLAQVKETTHVLVFDPYPPALDLLNQAFHALSVQTTAVATANEFEQALKNHAYSHVFFDYAEGYAVYKATSIKAKCIAMLDFEQMMTADQAPGLMLITKPVYCVVQANILNGEVSATATSRNQTKFNFIAPTARILVVDDNETNLLVASGLLKQYQFQIDTATSGYEALDKLQADPHYDLVLMDHMMPGMDGIETTHKIKELPDDYYQKLPVIALTANAVSGVKDMFLKEGFQDFISKPIIIPQLDQVLLKWLPSEKLEKRKKEENQAAPQEGLHIEGLDTKQGLIMSGGLDSYISVLKSFYKSGKKKRPQIETYAQGDWPAFTIEVHAVKSTAKTIGAEQLSEMAKALEAAGKEEDAAFIAEHFPAFHELYRITIENIEKGLQQESGTNEPEPLEASTITADPALLREKLQEIIAALDVANKKGAKTILAELATMGLNATWQQRVEQIGEAIDAFSYDEGSALCQEGLKQLAEVDEPTQEKNTSESITPSAGLDDVAAKTLLEETAAALDVADKKKAKQCLAQLTQAGLPASGWLTEAQLTAIEEAIDLFDYDEAVAQIKALLS